MGAFIHKLSRSCQLTFDIIDDKEKIKNKELKEFIEEEVKGKNAHPNHKSN